jgi:hypothetical protein
VRETPNRFPSVSRVSGQIRFFSHRNRGLLLGPKDRQRGEEEEVQRELAIDA